MARVKSITHLAGGAAGSGGEDRGSKGSVDRPVSVALSDTGSHIIAGGSVDEGSRVWSYFFGPLTVMVSRIHGVIDHGYFADGMGCEPREEVVPKP
jgi:hypothetical protein